jgi:hypothetical protein
VGGSFLAHGGSTIIPYAMPPSHYSFDLIIVPPPTNQQVSISSKQMLNVVLFFSLLFLFSERGRIIRFS